MGGASRCDLTSFHFSRRNANPEEQTAASVPKTTRTSGHEMCELVVSLGTISWMATDGLVYYQSPIKSSRPCLLLSPSENKYIFRV